MPKHLMNNIKCAGCGLVNWAGERQCKRCTHPLTEGLNESLSISDSGGSNNPLSSSRGIMVLAVILGFAVLTLLLHRVLHLISPDVAKMAALMFMLSGLVLLIITHLWLALRIFEENPLLGLISLLTGLFTLIAVSMYWEKLRTAFISQLISLMIFLVGYGIVAGTR